MSLFFAVAALHKLKAPLAFKAAVRDYEVIPSYLLGIFSILLIILELLSAAMVLIPFARFIGLAMMLGLLTAYSTGIAINLFRGRRDIDCGCNGPTIVQPLSWWLVFRNLVFFGLVLIAVQPTISRPLNWLDFFTMAAAVIVSCGLYMGFSQLLAQAPRLASLQAES